jgi:hypothetical protein
VKPLLEFMRARHAIYLARAAGKPQAEWTADPIFRKYRFCNVYRELDTVTQWVREHIRKPYAEHPNLWFMLALARQINLPETLQELMNGGAWPVRTWDPGLARDIMLARQARGEKLYTSAYMLNAHGRGPKDPADKAFFTCFLVLQQAWDDRRKIAAAFAGPSMQAAWASLLPHHGWGGFTAYEVVCDARYTRYGARWRDINRWAHAGPGAVRGLNRLHGRPLKTPLKQIQALEEMQALMISMNANWEHKPVLELREIEHSLCEYDKYQRVLLGEGAPRQKFVPNL